MFKPNDNVCATSKKFNQNRNYGIAIACECLLVNK